MAVTPLKIMKFSKKLVNLPLSFALSICLSLGIANVIRAERPEKAPSELTEAIAKIDLAANNHDWETLKQYIAPQFSSQDGLNYQSFAQLLAKSWQNYPNLTYQTTLKSWEQKVAQLVAETVTEIRGTFDSDGRKIDLFSTIHSLQYFEDGQLVRQEILQERTDLISGENPPEVEVILPEKARPGEQFNFDVIVKEPLGSELLLGAAMEEKIDSERYLNPSQLKLDALSAGGIFKLVTAPQVTNDRWYSAIVIRSDGMRLITQRVRIED
jgi:hypothetical protein